MAAHTGYYSESASFDNVNQAVAQAELYKEQAAASAATAAASISTIQTSAQAADASAQAALASSTTSTTASQTATSAAMTATSASTAAGVSATAAATSATASANSATASATSAAASSNSATAAAASATAIANQAYFGFKNKIVNGAMTIQQRGGYFGVTTGTAFPLDRWSSTNNGANGQMGVQVSNMPVNSISIPVLQATTVQVMTDSSGTKHWSPFTQSIEGYNMMDLVGSPVTVSFRWLSSLSGTYCVSLADGPTAGKSCVQTFTAVGGVVQKVSITFPAIPIGVASQFSNTIGLTLRIGSVNTGTYSCPAANLGTWQNSVYISTNSATNWGLTVNANVNVSEVQLELGSLATAFDRRPYPTELALCQRYYNKGQMRWDGYATSGVNYSTSVYFPVTMRATPTVAITSTSATGFPNTAGSAVSQSTSGLTEIRNASSTAGGNYFSNYSADAEL